MVNMLVLTTSSVLDFNCVCSNIGVGGKLIANWVSKFNFSLFLGHAKSFLITAS